MSGHTAIAEQIGKQIREAREKLHLRQEDLADAIGKKRQTIINYETGVVAIPADALWQIANKLAMTEVRINGSRFAIQQHYEPPLQEATQFTLDFEREHVFPNATVKISPTRMSITITATASYRAA